MFSSKILLTGTCGAVLLYTGLGWAQDPTQPNPPQSNPSRSADPQRTPGRPDTATPPIIQPDSLQRDPATQTTTPRSTTQRDSTQRDTSTPSTTTQPDSSQHDGSANRSAIGAPDEKFIMEAAKGGHHEVEMGRIGIEKATNPSVKEFAQKIVDDHTKANSELEFLAQQKGVTLPSSNAKDSSVNKLSKASGANFDREFMNKMVADHQKDIAAFEKEANSGSDPEVKNWASKTLPTLRSHLDQAKSIKP